MNQENDSFGLFADVLAGTLGLVALIALLMVLAAGEWDETPPDASLAARRSRAIPVQLDLARGYAAAAREDLQSVLGRRSTAFGMSSASLLDHARDAVIGQHRVEHARDPLLVEENLRLATKVAELEVLHDALGRMVADIQERRQRTVQGSREQQVTSLRSLREQESKRRPFYLLCRAGRLYPVYHVTSDGFRRNRADLSWIEWPNQTRLRCLPLRERGWGMDTAQDELSELAPRLAGRNDVYVVVLVFPDSHLEAREALRWIEAEGLDFSWQPVPAGEGIDFSPEGLPPPPPL